jgi:hypothetical protein
MPLCCNQNKMQVQLYMSVICSCVHRSSLCMLWTSVQGFQNTLPDDERHHQWHKVKLSHDGHFLLPQIRIPSESRLTISHVDLHHYLFLSVCLVSWIDALQTNTSQRNVTREEVYERVSFHQVYADLISICDCSLREAAFCLAHFMPSTPQPLCSVI